jgi:CoA:oxalate CoA-transferase
MVDVGMLDSQISLLTFQAGIYFMTGISPKRKGNQHPTICPYETFKAKDRYLNIAVGNDKLWGKFCELLGLEELRDHPDYATNPVRVKNRDRLFPIIQEVISGKESAHWMNLFEDNGIPAGPILSVEETLNHPQSLSRDMVLRVKHTRLGEISQTGIPIKLSETPGSIASAPPCLGEHTETVLKELGYSSKEIESMRSEGVI